MKKDKVSLSSPDISDADIQAVTETLRTGRLALGPQVELFEQSLASYVGTRHAIAVSSGTAGLHLLIRALGIGPGDEVLVPSFTFVASVSPILFEKASVRFVDIENTTFQMSIPDLESKISSKTKAIMAVDPFGHPVDWDGLNSVAKKHNLAVIDDACEAIGAEYKGTRLGSFGDAAVFAFYPNKQITTGEGGMIVTDNDEIAYLARCWRNQGREPGDLWLEHKYLGYNYRMDEMSAALGNSQLKRIDSILAKRETVAKNYTEALKTVRGIKLPEPSPQVKQSWFAYVIVLEPGISREVVIESLTQDGVPVRPYFVPIHTQAFIKEYDIVSNDLPNTEAISQSTLAIPFHPYLSEREVGYVAKSISKAVEKALGTKKAA